MLKDKTGREDNKTLLCIQKCIQFTWEINRNYPHHQVSAEKSEALSIK